MPTENKKLQGVTRVPTVRRAGPTGARPERTAAPAQGSSCSSAAPPAEGAPGPAPAARDSPGERSAESAPGSHRDTDYSIWLRKLLNIFKKGSVNTETGKQLAVSNQYSYSSGAEIVHLWEFLPSEKPLFCSVLLVLLPGPVKIITVTSSKRFSDTTRSQHLSYSAHIWKEVIVFQRISAFTN